MNLLSVLRLLIGIQLIPLAQSAKEVPTFSYWHIWTDQKGITHQTRCDLHNFVLQSMNPPASPQWQNKMKSDGAKIIVTVQPIGWQGPWHEDPQPQWIIPLSGRWFVETTDGKRTEMGPGDVSFGEDQNSKPDPHGHLGHFSGTVGQKPTVLMVVQLKDPPKINQPCHFK
jgi:hypothetical protein